jgi:hypothetical protein
MKVRIMIAVGLMVGAGTTACAAPTAVAPRSTASTDVTASGSPRPSTSPGMPDSPSLVPVFDPNTGASESVDPDTAERLITAYWTPDRLASATPDPLAPAPTVPDSVADGTTTTVFSPSSNPLVPAAYTLGEGPPLLGPTLPMPAADGPVGRVLFRDPADGKNKFCSGSALNTPKKRMVLTAGHCVHDVGGGGWMQNLIFEPGFENVPGKAGIFTIFTMSAWTAFTQGGDPHYDYGVMITHVNGGGKLVSQVGGNGLIVNPGRPFVTYIGYSSDQISNRVKQEFCEGQLTRFSVFISAQVLPCLLFGGASGAPWMIDVNNGFGVLVSDTTGGSTPGSANPVFGPYFDGDTASLVVGAEAASP